MTDNLSFGWDDEVEESSFELMPDGDYWFEVTKFERSWFEPKDPTTSRIPACNQANIELTIRWKNAEGKERENKVTYQLKLVKNLSWLIYQFFEAVGLRRKGDGTTTMPWGQIVGKKGVCEIGHREGSRGGTFNEVRKCYPPEDAPTVTKNEKDAAPVFAI